MTRLGLAEAAREEWNRLKTCRYHCLRCGAVIQACKNARWCQCADGSRIGVGGTIYCQEFAWGPLSAYEQLDRSPDVGGQETP